MKHDLKFFFRTIFFLFLLTSISVRGAVDTMPPTGRLIEPKSGTVYTTDVIRFSATASDSGSGVAKVIFCIEYEGKRGELIEDSVGLDSIPPYEYIYDASRIPDQHFMKLAFKCIVQDRAGNWFYSWDSCGRECIVIDRNPLLSKRIQLSYYTGKQVLIDGNLSEWARIPGDTTTMNDNRVIIKSMWDKKYLYFGIMVFDQYVCSPQDEIPYGYLWNDYLDLLFDVNHNHSYFREKEDKQILISASGTVLPIQFYAEERKIINQNNGWGSDIQSALKIKGTNNDNSDMDTGYIFEGAVPFVQLGVVPKKNMEIGFEWTNRDADDTSLIIRNREGVKRILITWGDIHFSQVHNPSEWGNLKLVNFASRENIFLLIIFLVCTIVTIIILWSYVNNKNNLIPVTHQQALVKKAEQYILEHYQDEDLNRETIAHFLYISSVYLGNIFKRHTRKAIPVFINEVRIRKSEKLILETNKSITDIAIETGYNNIEYFIKIFKKKKGITPKEFRKKFIS